MSWPILHIIKNVLPTLHVLRNTCSFKAFAPSVEEDGPGSRKRYKEGDSNRKAEDGGK